MEKFVLLFVGIIFIIIGTINMFGNISTVHFYNRKKVKEEDIPKYGKFIGLGTIIIGIGLIAKFTLDLLTLSIVGTYSMISLLVIGVSLMLYAQFKFNKGIF